MQIVFSAGVNHVIMIDVLDFQIFSLTTGRLPEILWPHNASCGARAVNVQIYVGSSQLFWDETFVVLTDPVPSTNYHNGNNNMQSIVWLLEQKTHTLFIWLFAYWSLYTWASKPFQQVFYGRAIRPHREAMGVWSYRITGRRPTYPFIIIFVIMGQAHAVMNFKFNNNCIILLHTM